MYVFKELWKAAHIETRGPHYVVVICRVADETGERILLQIQESGGALDVREAARILKLHQFEPFAAHETESQLAQQLLVMQLADSEEIHNLAVKIVEDFHARWFLMEENLSAAGKGFDVGRVLRKYFNDPLG